MSTQIRNKGLAKTFGFQKRGKNYMLTASSKGQRVELTGKEDGELLHGFVYKINDKSGQLEKTEEWHHILEWQRIAEFLKDKSFKLESGGLLKLNDETEWPSLPKKGDTPPPQKKDPLSGKRVDTREEKPNATKMAPVGSDVHVVKEGWIAGAEARLRIERNATKNMRKGMTENLNNRKGKALEGVKDNCNMAEGLSKALIEIPGLLETPTDTDKEGGLLCRIMGSLEGQGQHAKGTSNKDVAEKVLGSLKRILTRVKDGNGNEKGGGTEEDGNLVMQFMSCFCDGLTEILEGNKKAKAQLDQLWKVLGLDEALKEKLMDRVSGYKEIANSFSDTGVGKGTRKNLTRPGYLPNDERHQVFDESALVKGDISGSMHSSLLAQELAETLFAGKPMKGKGDSISVKDKGLLDARVNDALSLTAGGKDTEKDKDTVLHTAYEMINGIQGITGLPPVSQAIATKIMELMGQGKTFTDAVEEVYSDVTLPWQV